MAEPLLLPEPDSKYPLMIVGRYHGVELGFVLSEDNASNEDAISKAAVRMCECLVKVHKGELDAGIFNLEIKNGV